MNIIITKQFGLFFIEPPCTAPIEDHNIAYLSIAYLTLTYVTLQQRMVDHPDYKYQPTKNMKKKKLPFINGTQQGSGAFAPPGGNRGQPSFSESILLGNMNLGTFGDQGMASVNGPVTYGGFLGSNYPQIASHNATFQG